MNAKIAKIRKPRKLIHLQQLLFFLRIVHCCTVCIHY